MAVDPLPAAATLLVLVGTIHSDPQGYRRTRRLLERHSPDLIFVELSPYGLRYRQDNGSALWRTFSENLRLAARRLAVEPPKARRHRRIDAIARQIKLPFEYRAAAAYASRRGATVIAADSSEFSRQWIETWAELISAQNLEILLTMDSTPDPVSRQYDTAARLIRGDVPAPGTLSDKDFSLWQDREEGLARNIRTGLFRNNPVRPLYIGGWMHLMSHGRLRSIRDLLGISLTRCFLLDRGPL